jgi:membrane fusion protein (multidrug efflux system)
VDTSGQNPWVLRLRDGKAERVQVSVGVRDDRSERVEILSGIAAGDLLLAGAARAVTPGTPVTITGAAAPQAR